MTQLEGPQIERRRGCSTRRMTVSRRESIVVAAVELFAARGYEATSTAELARVAGVSEGTIFHHFKTKDGVLVHILTNMMDGYIDAMERNLSTAKNGLEGIEGLIRFHFAYVEAHSRESLVIFRDIPSHILMPDFPARPLIETRTRRFIQFIRDNLERGKQDGTIRDVPVEQTIFILRGMLVGLTRLKLLGPIEVPDLSEELIDFCRRSLARPS
ncbi:MAG: TetR/AcrR family transcriptional regulator [Syntrophobacteraceae bacterium]